MIDISNIRDGDRVRLTRENGDEMTFTVRSVQDTSTGMMILHSLSNTVYPDSWDTIEVLKKPAHKPLPTKPGLYALKPYRNIALLHDGMGNWKQVHANGTVIDALADVMWIQSHADADRLELVWPTPKEQS